MDYSSRVMLSLGSSLPGRNGQIMSSLQTVLDKYTNGASSAELGVEMRKQALDLGGLMLKVLQQTGTRADIVMDDEIRAELRLLQADCDPREQETIQQQVSMIFPSVTIDSVAKAGTIGEVSRAAHEGNNVAVKTINPNSQALFKADFDNMNSVMVTATTVIVDALGLLISSDKLKNLQAVMRLVTDSVTAADFQNSVVGEFDLRVEAENMNAARPLIAEDLRHCEWSDRIVLDVPTVIKVSDDGACLVTDWIDGKNLSDLLVDAAFDIDREAAAAVLVKHYLLSLLKHNRLHGDLHPGNVLANKDERIVKLWLVDWGAVLCPCEEFNEQLRKLMMHIHLDDQRDNEVCREAFESFGVTTTTPEDKDQYTFLSNSFDLLRGTTGLDLSENFNGTRSLGLPAWVLLWQKATAAFVVTLQALQKGCSSDLRKVVQEECRKFKEASIPETTQA